MSTYMRKRPLCNIVLTPWFNKSISFSISTSFETISGDFDIFSLHLGAAIKVLPHLKK